MIKNNISISNFTESIAKFFKRFHSIIFFLVVSAGLFIAIVILLPITSLATEDSKTTGQKIDGTFDQSTIDRLREGNPSGSSSTPGERKSPFVE